MNIKIARRVMLMIAPLLLLSACSDDPVKPDPGPKVETYNIYSSSYLNNRFFKLDLPEQETNGRVQGERIDLASVQVFQLMGPGTPTVNDVANIAVYVDSTGWRDWGDTDFAEPSDFGARWRWIPDYTVQLDPNENLLAIDLGRDVGNQSILAVTYDIVGDDGNLIGRVGDNPGTTGQSQQIVNDPANLYYRMKLLKAHPNIPDPHVFQYVLRNIYSLGASNIDPSGFDLRIEENDLSSDRPDKDEQGYDYFRIFGLDNMNYQFEPGADGVVDSHNALVFDLQRGLLFFPMDFPVPFAATDAQYVANVNDSSWVQPDSFLSMNLTPQIYDMDVPPTEYFNYQKFKIVVEMQVDP